MSETETTTTEQQTTEQTTEQTSESLLTTVQTDESGAPQVKDGEWLMTPTLKGVGDKPEFMLSKFKTMDAQAEAYGELEKKFGAFTGSPDEYTLNMPEGIDGEFDSDDPLLKAGIEFAKESNMSQDAFDKMVSMWMQNSAAMETQERDAEIQSLGKNSAQRIQAVTNFLQNNLEADAYGKIEKLMTSAESVQIVEMLVNATAPKTPPIDGGANPESVTKAKLHEMRFATIQDGRNKGELRVKMDPAYRKEVEAYAEKLLGTD